MIFRRKPTRWVIGLIGIVGLVALACSSAEVSPSSSSAPAAPAVAPAAPVAPAPRAPAGRQQPAQPAPAAPALPGLAPGVQPLPGQGIAAAPVRSVPATSSGAGDPKYGGVLRYGRAPNVEHIFTLSYSGGACASWCMDVGDPVTAYGPDSEWVIEKSMAKSFTVSDDQQTITFKLKDGLLFHDGTTVDADAIKFSLDYVLDPANAVVTRSAVNVIDSVDVIDSGTFSVHTSSVFAPIITNLGMSAGMPFSPTAFALQGVEGFENSGAPTTGPFVIKEWVSGSHTSYERNPQYHREGYPYLDGLRWVEIPEDQVRVAAMRTRELDVTNISPSSTDAIKSLRDVSEIVEFKGFAGPRMDHFNAARAPFDDIRVRQAAQMAMDRVAWNQAMTGGEGYLYRGSLVPPGHAASYEVPEDEFPYAYNPERARELLEEYAAEKGISLPLSRLSAFTCTPEQAAAGCVDLPEQPITITASSSPANIARAEISQAFYNAIGFDVQMDIGSGDEAKRTFVTKEASFSLRGFGLRPHPSGTFNSYLGMGGYWNNGGWGTSPEQVLINEAVTAATAEFDFDKQNDLYREAQRIYMEAALGGVRSVNQPSYWFAQPWVRWDGYPDAKFIKFPSDNNLHVHNVWLEEQ